MLGIRTLLGLEPKGEILTSSPDAVLPFWMGTLSVEGIPGRWGKANIVARGDETRVLTPKQIYEETLARRTHLEDEKLAA